MTLNPVGDWQPSEEELAAFERQVERAREAAKRLEGVRDRQTGSIRGQRGRRARRKAAKQARKRNR